jgi:hypothetical protein
MPLHQTRSMVSEADFKFIIGTILNQKEDSPMSKAFRCTGISDLGDITLPSDRVIDCLECQDNAVTSPAMMEPGLGHQQPVCCFNAWVETKNDDGNPIRGDWQNKATQEEFNEHRLVGFAKCTDATRVSTPATVTSGGGTGGGLSFPPRARDPVFEFKKGIKRPGTFFCFEGEQVVGLRPPHVEGTDMLSRRR